MKFILIIPSKRSLPRDLWNANDMTYLIRHVTSFSYQPAVGESVMEVRLQPRSDPRQRCLTSSIEVNPRANVSVHRDFYGNAVHHFDIPGKHSTIEVVSEATVDMLPRLALETLPQSSWQELDELVAHGDYWEMLLPSQYARPSEMLLRLRHELHLERRCEPLALLKEINTAIYENFDYVPNTTRVDSPIDEALQTRQGVCQDFAHIMIALVRQLRIPCRYVSGYLYHQSESHDRSPAGASHAWVEAYLGELGWVELDPTNNLLGCERHIRVAVGRDYADVPPTRGVHRGEAESELRVLVTVSLVDAPKPEDLGPAMVFYSSRPAGAASQDVAQMHAQQQQQ
jgi:transglutaminase-like putative cysteine protease